MISLPAARLPAKPILVIGGYGYRNVGDDAILAGLLELLGSDRVTVVSRAPAETAARYGVEAIGITGAIGALRHHRGVVIGGGGLFGRDMGLVGRLLPLFGLVAWAAGREVALIGVGIDRQMPRSARWLMQALARRARIVVVRDRESADVLAAAGIGADVQPDLSTRAPSVGRMAGTRALRAAGLDPARRPVVGLALTAVNAALVEPLVAAVTQAVDAFPSVDFCLIPMSRHPFVATHNDALLARRLTLLRPRLRTLAAEDPATVLGVFEALSAAVCMRYHSLLFADRAGTPIVPIVYADKCRTWLAERGREPIQLSPETLVRAIRAALGERQLGGRAAPDASIELERSA